MQVIQKTFSFRLKPTSVQAILLAQFAGSARYIYNFGLALIKDALDKKQKVPTYTDIANKLPFLKRSPETAWLKAVHSQILQQALKNLESAFKHFVKVGRFLASTKQCSSCGNVQSISLQTRVYTCFICGLQLDRDLNASINIRAAGLFALKACGELSIG